MTTWDQPQTSSSQQAFWELFCKPFLREWSGGVRASGLGGRSNRERGEGDENKGRARGGVVWGTIRRSGEILSDPD